MEAWISTKISAEDGDAPHWHIPNKEELSYANALLDQHLRGAVSSLRDVCKSNRQAESSGGVDCLAFQLIIKGKKTLKKKFRFLPLRS